MSKWHDTDWAVSQGPVDGRSDNSMIVITHAKELGGDVVNQDWPNLIILKAISRVGQFDGERLAALDDEICNVFESDDIGI